MNTTQASSRRRLDIEFSKYGIEPFCSLGKYNYSRAQGELPLHHHPDSLEICYLVKGRQVYRVAGRNWVFSGGEVFVTFPDEKHGSGGFPEEKGVLYWFLVRLKGLRNRNFLGLAPALGKQLISQLGQLPSRCFKGEARMQQLLDSLVILSMSEGDPLKTLNLSSMIIEFLLLVIDCSRKNRRAQSSQEMTALLRYIDDHLEESLSVPNLAKQLLLSTSRFKARFKREMGLPPAEYVLRSRIERAKQLLQTKEKTITQVGLELGFSTSQNFATVFKRYTGVSPRDWDPRKPGGSPGRNPELTR